MILYPIDGKPREAFPLGFILRDDHGVLVDLTGSTLQLVVEAAGAESVFRPINDLGPDGRASFRPSEGFLEGLPDRYAFDVILTEPSGLVRTVLQQEVERGPAGPPE